MIFEDPSHNRVKKAIRILTGIIFLFGLASSLDIIAIFLMKTASLDSLIPDAVPERRIENPVKKRDDAVFSRNMGILTDDVLNNDIDKEIRLLKKLAPLSQKPFIQGIFINNTGLGKKDEEHLKQADVLFPEWLSLRDITCGINEEIDKKFLENIKNPILFPVFSNVSSIGERSFPLLIKDEKGSACLIESLKQSVKKIGGKGIDLDLSIKNPYDSPYYIKWLISIVGSFHEDGLYVAVNVPMDDPAYDYKRIGSIADIVIARGFDEHSFNEGPGSLAGSSWFDDNIDELLKDVPKEKIMVAIGSYGYDWNLDENSSPILSSYKRIINIARNVKSVISLDKETLNNRFSYIASDGSRHDVWFLDAITAWNQYLKINQKKLYGVSLWGYGKEDPSIWKFFKKREEFIPVITKQDVKPKGNAFNMTYSLALKTEDNTKEKISKDYPELDFNPKVLTEYEDPDETVFSGGYIVYRVNSLNGKGIRRLETSGGKIISSDYEKLPQRLSIKELAHPEKKTFGLIFRGGNDKGSIYKILELLKKNDLKAAFFHPEESMDKFPGVQQKEYSDGHLIGIHILNGSGSSKESIENKKDLLGYITGHSTILAYPIGFSSAKEDDIRKLYEIGKSGYLLIGSISAVEKLKGNDIEEKTMNLISEIEKNDNGIIEFGTDQDSYLILKRMIDGTKSRGYSFKSFDEITHVSRASIMTEVPINEKIRISAGYFFKWLKDNSWTYIAMIFLFSTGVSVFRIVFLGLFVIRSVKPKKKPFSRKFVKMPPATILVPAYNEEKVIERTVLGLLNSDYPEFEILVINDGSKDDTAGVVQKLCDKYPNVRLINKKNEGKSLALNLGFKEARYDYILTIDADTITFPYTVRSLMEPFVDPEVDSVCGNILVGNVKNILTAFQEVEYVTGQNFDRRAFDALNCISVVPGATGAWKKSKVLEIGGYSKDTLVEDADLTLSLLEANGKIVYSHNARSVTEAPETVKALFKQRFRWSYGTFQCFWKHRKTFGKGALGTIALPNMIIGQIFQNFFSPLGDIVFIFSIFIGNINSLIISYWIFLLMDILISGIAYGLDQKSMTHAWVLLINRFFYRQFLYVVTFKSLLAAFIGSHHGWNKLERKGTVEVTQ